ncbi:hypothetical protein [Sarcina ventriculi]|uniref:hypothetical protein n=1 Tax=Sarcina ventriculi TaxID=1267 RepID=UPI0018AA5CE5|nr:hypothetical protein [Sarcina ventriculi]
MAEEGSLELAPLRAKVVLDLTQFDEGMEQIIDKTDELKDVKVPVKINLNNNPEELEEVTEEIKETAQQTAESFFDILNEAEQADQEILELGNNFEVVGEKVEEVVQYTETMKESIAELEQQVAEVDGHDFIINYNGEQIHAMAQDMEELTNATHVYQDALARLTSEQGEFDERLNLDYYTLEEFETEIKASTEVLQGMIEKSRGLNIDLSESQEALQDNIPLWEDLTEQQQAEFKSVGELEYNLQALQARFLEVSNAIGNLGDAMETATAKQQQFNNAVENSQNDVSEYNADAMEYIEAYAQQIETVEESTKANNNNRKSLTASQEAMNEYKEKLIETYQALEREGVRVKKLQTLYKDLTSTQREGVNQFKNDTEALENNINRVVESYNKLNKAGKLDAQANEELKDTIDELVSASSRLQESLMLDQANFNRTQITAQETGREFNSVTDKAEVASEKTGIMSSNIKSYGESWWTTATMAMTSIQMITSSMGELLNTGAEVELSGIGLTETFGKQGAEAIQNFTQNANDANLTLQEVLPTAQTLGLALRQYGGTKTQIASVTTQIMNMANQLQLATGGAVSFSEGADAIRQELAGQSYALKSLGINLSNTLLNQTALNSQWHTSYNKLDSYQQAVIKVDALQGQLNKTFGTTSTYLKSQAGQYEKNIAEFKNNMAKLGEDLLPLANAILPSILKIVEKIVSVVDKIKSNQWLVNKIEWLAKVGIKLVEIGVTIAILTKSVVTFIEVWERLPVVKNIILRVISSMDPMGLVILGIIASVVLLYEAWKHNWFNIRGITKKAVDGIEYYWGRCKADTVMIWNGIMTGLRNTWRLLSSEAKQQFNEVINKIKYYWGRCKADTLMIWNGIKNGLVQTWRTLTNEASEQWNMVVNKIKYYCGRCKADTLMIWNGIVSGIIQTITILKDEAIQQWNSIYYGIRQVVEEIKANVINDWDSLKYGVLEVIETLENIIESIWNNIYSVSVSAVQNTVSAVISEFEGLYDDVVNIFDDIWNTISGIWNDITSKLGSIGGMINNATGGLFMSMPTGFASLPTVNNFSTTNITNTTSTNLSTIQTQTDSLPIQNIPTIGELHIHSPQTLDPLETYNQMQQWSINMANGLY